MGPTTCPHHEKTQETLADHESRLRLKWDRLLRMEMEVEHMRETLEAILSQNKEIKACLDALRAYQTYAMGAIAAGAAIWAFLSNNWGAILRLLGGG